MIRLLRLVAVLMACVVVGCASGDTSPSDSSAGGASALADPSPGDSGEPPTASPVPTQSPTTVPTPRPTAIPSPEPTPTPEPAFWSELQRAIETGDDETAVRIFGEHQEEIEDRGRGSVIGLESVLVAQRIPRVRAADRAVRDGDLDTATSAVEQLLDWFPDDPRLVRQRDAIETWRDQAASAVEWQGEVPHLFIHSLIIRPELAFDGDYQDEGYRTYMITRTEFERMLQLMYWNDYILIDIHDLYERHDDGSVSQRRPAVPPGKKPFVFSIDDVSYYEYMEGNGFAERLEIDDFGGVSTIVIDDAGNEILTRTGDAMPILDDFVLDNPDFALNGAKGIIAVTGYEGVLGYDFSRDQTDHPDFEQRRESARQVAQRLKELGWQFASHSYTHGDWLKNPQSGYGRFTFDGDNWNNEIAPVLGGTDIYISPFGYYLSNSNPRYRYLVEELGFTIFNPISDGVTMTYNEDNVVMHRIAVDGFMLGRGAHRLAPYFDPEKVWDSARDEG